MIRVPAEVFGDWQEVNDLSYLPRGFTLTARIRLLPTPNLPPYLAKGKAENRFIMAPRVPKNWLFLVNVILEALNKLRRKQWVPEAVEVFIRWEPKRAAEKARKT